MEILNTSQFISERMKVMPINNDEFDKVKEFGVDEMIKIEKIKNPKYEDILVPGNVVVTKEKKDNIYICWGKYNSKDNRNVIDLWFTSDEIYVMVCRTGGKELYNYLLCKHYSDRFPKCDLGCAYNYNIKSVYKTNINLSNIKSEEEFLDLFDKIKIP